MMFLPHQTSATHRSKPVASRQPPSAAPGQHPWEVYYRFYHKLDAVAKGTTRQWQHPSGRSNLQRTKICKNMLHATRMFCGLNEANSAWIKISEDIYDIWRYLADFAGPKAPKIESNGNCWHRLAIFHARPWQWQSLLMHEVKFVSSWCCNWPSRAWNSTLWNWDKQNRPTQGQDAAAQAGSHFQMLLLESISMMWYD
jgi:hypothetical protein